MRRFVSDFLLPVVRGGAAHVGRPLGLSAVDAHDCDELPLTEGDALAEARRLPAWRARSRLARWRRRRRSTRPACAWAPRCTTCSALGHPELGGARSRRADRVAAAALELASVGAPPSAQRGGEPALAAGAAARDRARRSHRALLAGAADVRGPPAAAPGDGAARAAARARRTDQPELAARDRHPGGGAAGVPRAQRRQPAGRGAGSAPPRSARRLGADSARAALSRAWRASSPARR